MSKYIKLFENHTQYETFIGGGGETPFVRPNVSHCIEENEVHYSPKGWQYEYLTFVALEDGTFKFSTYDENIISYSVDEGKTWTELAANTDSPTVTTGNKIMWTGELTKERWNSGIGNFVSTGPFDVQGNIMSLLYGDDFNNETYYLETYIFSNLFNGQYVVNAKNLVLPATTLSNYCYEYMFVGCAGLITAPKLPATMLGKRCYQGMFEGCTSLVNAPELLATTMLGTYCCEDMFKNCTSLITAPQLHATTLSNYCYYNMFNGCTSIETAPELPATTLAEACYSNMFYGCTSLTVTPELPATTLVRNCYSSMFENTNVLPDCSNIDFTSEVVVSSGGLRGLFSGTKVTDSDLDRLLPKNNGKYCLPVMTLASGCYTSMFSECTSLITAPELPATTLAQECYYHMFEGCTSLTTAPVLLATTVERNSYSYMFNGCTSLNYIKAMFTTQPNQNRTNYWVQNVASSGTFVKNAAAEWGETGVHAVPTGWTVVKETA